MWFVEIIKNLTSLGSREFALIFSVLMYFYLIRSNGKVEARKFFFTIGIGVIIIFVTKVFTSKHEDLSIVSIITETISYFPSGHAFMTTVLYLAMAHYLTKNNNDPTLTRYIYTSASIIIGLVCISLFMGSGHTVTEVIAGWSLGLCWYTFAQLFLRIDHKTVFNK
jgi:undecaprenyl-diphosphatase